MEFSEWWQLVSGIAFFRSWWFLLYLVLPLAVVGITCLIFRQKPVDTHGAWNAVGRLWAGIGWAGIIVAVVLYLGAALWWVPTVPVVTRSNVSVLGKAADIVGLSTGKKMSLLQAYQVEQKRIFGTKANEPAVVFVRDYYAWFHALPVTVLMWVLLWIGFVRPGGKMVREETDLLSVE